MKKRILAVVTAAILALGCASTAFAKDSWSETVMGPKFSAAKFGISGAKTTVGDYRVNVSEVNMNDTGLVGKDQTVTDIQKAKAVMFNMLKERAGVSASQILAIFNADYDDLDDVNGTELVFYVENVKAGDSIAIWHWDNTTLNWEQNSCRVTKVESRHVYANVKKLSPIAFVKGGSNAVSGNGSTSKDATKAATNGKAAPKTGEV